MSLKTLQNFYKTTTSRAWAIGTGNRYVTTLPTPSSGYLVINPSNTSKKEIITYTAKGTDGNGNYVTVSARGVGGTTEQTHAVGEPVRMNIVAEHYSDVQTELTTLQDEIDTLVLQNAPNSSTTVKGIVKISVAPASSTEPIAVGDNDPRVNVSGAPTAYITTSAGAGDSGKVPKLNASGILDTSFMQATVVRTYNYADSPATWTKPSTLKALLVQMWGGGGGGGGGATNCAGGGGGAYKEVLLTASVLGATETITIGFGGALNTAGGNTSFGSLAIIYGGGSGGDSADGGAGGGGGGSSAVGGDGASTGGTGGAILGGAGGNGASGVASNFGGGGGADELDGGNGGDSYFGGGGGMGRRSGGANPNRGGNSEYGGGGGAGAGAVQTGGTSKFGGAGGAPGVAGTVPAGGGGSNAVGGNGRVIIFELY